MFHATGMTVENVDVWGRAVPTDTLSLGRKKGVPIVEG